MKVFEKLTEAVTIEGLMLSYNEKRNEGTSKLIASRRKTKKKKTARRWASRSLTVWKCLGMTSVQERRDWESMRKPQARS